MLLINKIIFNNCFYVSNIINNLTFYEMSKAFRSTFITNPEAVFDFVSSNCIIEKNFYDNFIIFDVKFPLIFVTNDNP